MIIMITIVYTPKYFDNFLLDLIKNRFFLIGFVIKKKFMPDS